MKKTLQCPKCQGEKIGCFETVMDYSDALRFRGIRSLATEQEGSFFKGRKENNAHVEAYVCTECGYFEEYVKFPENVAWEKFSTFKWPQTRH